MKNKGFKFRNLITITFLLVSQFMYSQTIGDGPGGLPSTNMLFWYNASNVRQTTGVVTQWNDSKVNVSNFLSPSVVGTLTYNSTGFTATGDNMPFYSIPSTSSLLENLSVARSNQSGYEIWVVAKASGVNATAGNKAMRLFKITNVANSNNFVSLLVPYPASVTAPCSLQVYNNALATMSSSATPIVSNVDQLYYATIAKTGTSTASTIFGTSNTSNTTLAVNNTGLVDFVKLALNDPTSPAPYTNYAVAEVFGFTVNTTPAQKAIIQNYIYRKYYSGTDVYKYDYVQTNSGYGLTGSVNSGVLKLSTTNATNFAIAHDYQGAISYSLVTSLPSPYNGLKIRNEEWKVVTNAGNTAVVFSFDQSLLTGDTKSKVPYIIVKSNATTVSGIYPMTLASGKYSTAALNIPVNSLINIGYLEATCTAANNLTSGVLAWNITTLPSFTTITLDALTVKRTSTGTTPGILSLTQTSTAANTFTAANNTAKNPIEFSQVSSKKWCIAKVGDASNVERFSLSFTTASYPQGTFYNMGYNIIVDPNGDDVLTDAVIYTTSQLVSGTQGVNNVNLPNGSKVSIALDLIHFNITGASLSTIPNTFISHGTLNTASTYVSSNTLNDANLRRFDRWFNYTGTNAQAVLSFDKRLFQSLMGYITLQSYQVPVIIESSTATSSTAFVQNAKVYALTSPTGNVYSMNLSLKQGYYYTLGIINQQSLSGYTNFRATSGLLDLNYNFPSATVSNEFNIFTTTFKTYDHLVVFDNGGSYTLGTTLQTIGTTGTYSDIPFYVSSKAFRVQKLNNTSTLNIGFHTTAIDAMGSKPDNYYNVLVVDNDGNWSTTTDRSVVGLVRSGDYYYAYDQNVTTQSFALGIAKQADNNIVNEVRSIGFSNIPAVLPISQDLIVNTLTNFSFATACKQTVNNNILKVLVSTGETFQHGLDKTLALADFNFNITLDLSYKNASGVLIGTIETKTLNITGKFPEALYSKTLPAGTQTVTVSVKNITQSSSTPTTVDLNAIRSMIEVKADILQDLSKTVPQLRMTSLTNLSLPNIVDTKPIQFQWSTPSCPVAGYKFQLLRLYNTDPLKATSTTFDATADVDWSKALTLETINDNITLQLAEGTGYYTWRVMPHGNNNTGGVGNSNNWSNWSSDNTPSAATLTLTGKLSPNGYGPSVFYYTQLEDDKNFIYNRVFTEDGKSHENFTIADGLQEVRQTQSKLNSNKGTSNEQGSLIISQNVYDYSGRIAIKTLPAPVLDPNQEFGYRPEFIKEDATNAAYGPWSVDVKPDQTVVGLPNQYLAGTYNAKVSDNSLLGTYYSEMNPDTRVPNAEKYPFTRVIYSNDGNNEIVEQGGVGGQHQPFGGKTTKKNTAAASPNELIRLFGDETPEGVYRSSVTDQNGITSVSYTNRSGKTIATCLLVNDDPNNPLKKLPSTMDKLEGGSTGNPTILNGKYKVLSNRTILDKIENQINGNVIVSTQDFDLVGAQSVTIDYSFQPTKFLLSQCENFCVTCGYKVEVYIYDLNTGTLANTAGTSGNTANPLLEWLNPASYPTQASMDAKVADYSATSKFTLSSWTKAPLSSTSTVSLTGGSYRLFKVIRQATENDAKKVADDIEAKMNAVIDNQIVNPIKAKMALGTMKFVNSFIFDNLLTSYISAGASEPNFGTYVELIRTDVDGNQTALLANSKKTSTGAYFRDPSMLTYKDIKDDMKLKIVTSCCTMYVQLYEHRPDVCSPKEYLSEAELSDGISDHEQMYSNATYRAALTDNTTGLGASLVSYTQQAILNNPTEGAGYTVALDPIDFLLKKFNPSVTPAYTKDQFRDMTNNMMADYLLWKVDSLTLTTAAARDQSKYKIFQDMNCYSIQNSWKSIVEKYFAPIPADQRSAMNNTKASALLSTDNPGVNLDGVNTANMDAKVKKEPIDEHLSNVGYKYIGYVTSGDIKTQAYKLFTYSPRNSNCESMFCTADMNAGLNMTKLESEVDALNGEQPVVNLEPASAYPDITITSVKDALCRSYMANSTDPNICMPETEAIGTTHAKYLGSGSTTYNALKVRLYSQIAVTPAVYRYLNAVEYNMLKKCDEADDEVTADRANGSLEVDDIALAETENKIREIRNKLLNDCNLACEQKYNLFYAQVAMLYDPDGDGQYFANPKKLYGVERIKNYNFDPSLVPVTGNDGDYTTKASGDWRYIKSTLPIDIPASAFQNGNVDIAANPIYQNIPYLLSQSTAKTYALSFEILDIANITDFRIKLGLWNPTIYTPANFTYEIKNLNSSLKTGVVTFNFTIASASVYSALGFISTGTAGARLVIDKVSLKELTYSTAATAISTDDICCTANSLVQGCKDDCVLTEQVLECNPLPTMKAQIYYRTNLDIPATWKRAPSSTATDIVIPTNGAGIYPSLSGTNAYNFTLNVSTKQYYQLYIKSLYTFSNGKTVEVIWGKNYAPSTPDNLSINITQATVTLVDKSSNSPVFTITDGLGTYNSPSKISEVYKYLAAAKTSASCNGGNIAAITLSKIEYSYSYDGLKNGLWKTLSGPVSTIPMRDPAPKVVLEMKVRYIYTATGVSGEYKESCITKIDLGAFTGTRTYSPYFGLNKEITTYNGASSTLGTITGTRLYLVDPTNASPLLKGVSACDAKDLLKTQTDKRRVTVSPGTVKQRNTVNAIINGTFLLKPYCTTSCSSTVGYKLVDKSAVYSSCGQSVGKPTIKWQNTIPTYVEAPDNITIDSDGDFKSVTNGLDIVEFDRNSGIIKSSVYTGGANYIKQTFKGNDNLDYVFSYGNIYNTNGTLIKTLDPLVIDPLNVNCGKIDVRTEFLSKIVPYTDGYIVLLNDMYGNCSGASSNNNEINLVAVKLDNSFNYISTNPVKFLSLSSSLTEDWAACYVTYDYIDNTFVVVSEVYNNSNSPTVDILTHGNKDILVTKINKNFDKIIWRKLFGGNKDEILQRYFSTNSLIKTDDGGYLIAAATRSDNQGDLIVSNDLGGNGAPSDFPSSDRLDVWIFKIDKNGNKVWDKTFGGKKDEYPIGGIIKYGDYYVVGAKSFSTSKSELGSDGLPFDASSDRSDNNFSQYQNIYTYDAGWGYDAYGGNADSWIFVIDKNGNIRNDIALGGPDLDYPLALAQSTTNGYLLISNITSSSNSTGNINVSGTLGSTSTKNYNYNFKNWFVALDIPVYTCAPQPVYVKWVLPQPPKPLVCANPPCNPCPDGDCIWEPPVDPVKKQFTMISQALEMSFQRCKGQKSGEIMEQYVQNCIKPQQRETFSLQYSHAFHHYTLYYYDRSGNLIKTVPPAGVEPLALADLPANATAAQITTYKANLASLRNTATNHRMATLYTYNSAGQLIEQTTPDGGRSRYLYDMINKLRFSQSAQQAITGRFSYSKYDEFARIIEAGEANYPSGVTTFDQLNTTTYLDGIGDASFPTAGKTEYTVTVYSKPMNTVLQIAGTQRHLQNRVSYTYSIDTKGRRAVTYYSYDVHGNVEWIIQDIPGFSQYLISYDYDLISNKVTKVSFNKGRIDAFYHRYEYDADNRLTAVYTSRDNEIWDKDASYEYFKHGPLKRTVMGEDRVQGLDYTYTIHGWLKAINGHNPGANNDPSKDGAPADQNNAASKVAIDEWAMMLQYYVGDFKRTGSPYMESILPSTGTTAKDLFNGNISAWHSRTPEELRRIKGANTTEAATLPVFTGSQYTYSQAFTYDELNRIVASEAFKYTSRGDVVPAGSSPFLAVEDYKTAYTYDANGNILTLNRNGFINNAGIGKEMDKFTYKYNLDVNSKPLNNKLRGVDDAANYTYGNDLIDQALESSDNYEYDANGNLTKDVQGNINVTWNASGKVSTINPISGYGPNGIHLIANTINYTYDAMGNRIGKEVIPFKFDGGPGYWSTTTAYVRDAQGNVMAVYEKSTAGGYDGLGHTFTQKEVHLYGSSRLGMYTPNKQVANLTTSRANMDSQYLYEDVQKRSESNNLKWLQHIDKSQVVSTINRNYRYLQYATETFNTANSEYMDAGSTINNIPASVDRNIFQAEDKAGNILFSGFVARSYMGKSNVCLMFNSSNALMKNSGSLNMDPNAKSAVVQIPGSSDYMLISRGTDKKLYYHTINLVNGVLSKNIELVPSTVNYGNSLAVVEDFAQNKVVIYTTKFDPVLFKQTLLAITITKPSASIVVSSVDLYTQDAGVDNVELKISPRTQMLSMTTFDNNRLGFFEHRLATVNTFKIGADYKISDLDNQPAKATTGYVQPRTYQLEFDAIYEETVTSYRGITSVATGPNVLDAAYLPLTRRLDGNLSAFYNTSTSGVDMKPATVSRLGYGYFVVYNNDGSAGTVQQAVGANIVPYYHVQNYRKYGNTVTDPTFTRQVGAKSYELVDHLGNVSAVVSDLVYQVYPSTSTNTTVVLASATRPEGLYAQVLSYTHYYPFGMAMVGRNYNNYRYGYNGQEKSSEIEGSHTTALFWEYDSRIGRRWNMDPVIFPEQSPYVTLDNNPIFYNDVDGLAAKGPNLWQKVKASLGFGRIVGSKKANNQYYVRSGNLKYPKPENHVNNDKSNPETWYYLYKRERDYDDPLDWDDIKSFSLGHALIWNPNTNKVYEINHRLEGPNDRSGLKDWTDPRPGTPKSIHYVWDLNTDGGPRGRDKFWNYRGGRGHIDLFPIVVPNPEKAEAFFERRNRKRWRYNVIWRNCKDYVCKGLKKGGADFNQGGPLPESWNNSERSGTWNSKEDLPTEPLIK